MPVTTSVRRPETPTAPLIGASVSMRFAHAVRTLSEAARLQGLDVPIFRTRPAGRGVVRTVRRTHRGATVSIVVHDRPWAEVVGDGVDAIVDVNGLDGARAARCRSALWSALEREEDLAA